MKKKLLLMAAFVTALVSANAQNSITFDNNIGVISTNTNIGNYTIVVDSDTEKTMEVDENKGKFNNGITYETRLKTGGTATEETGKYIKFNAASEGTFKFAARTGKNDDETRTVAIFLNGKEIYNEIVKEANAVDGLHPIREVEIDGAGEVIITTPNGGINFYAFDFDGEGSGIGPIEPGDPISESVVFDNYIGEIKENKQIGVFTLIASDSKGMTVDENTAKFTNGETYTTRLKTGGTSTAEGRYIAAEFPTAGTLTIAARTGKNEDETRNLVVTFNGGIIYNEVVKEANATKEQYVNDKGNEAERNVYPLIEIDIEEPGDAKIEAPTGSLNFYYLAFESDNYEGGGISIEKSTTDKEVVASEYYTINGIRVVTPISGINIVRNIMSDGSVEVSKIYVK